MNVLAINHLEAADLRLSHSGATGTLRGIKKSFDAFQVLQGIDLNIRAGEFVAIVGRSGCGKSTLLRLIAGLDAPTEGSIAIDGQPTGWRDTVRLMFQEPRLLPWQRVIANVELGLARVSDAVRRRHQAEEVLAQVGLK